MLLLTDHAQTVHTSAAFGPGQGLLFTDDKAAESWGAKFSGLLTDSSGASLGLQIRWPPLHEAQRQPVVVKKRRKTEKQIP